MRHAPGSAGSPAAQFHHICMWLLLTCSKLQKLKKVTKALEDAEKCIALKPDWDKGKKGFLAGVLFM